MMCFLRSWQSNWQYTNTLKGLASLSNLFATSAIPYLDYRLAENVFCRSFNAINDARNCTAYDARIRTFGIGIKTFILKNNQSAEKIAEFNSLKPELDPLSGIDLARKLAQFRNDRIRFADDTYGTSGRIYHIVGRAEGLLRVFNDGYDFINIDNISILRNNDHTFSFTDGLNEYFFNRSKSVLIKRFLVPRENVLDIPVSIIQDPLPALLHFLHIMSKRSHDQPLVPIPSSSTQRVSPYSYTSPELFSPTFKKGIDYVILPLYSTRSSVPIVPEKSGLNQWNAGGRPRDPNEVYIPIPHRIHQDYPGFFPPRDEHFTLILPNGQSLSAKVCQQGGKALMSTHNADLGIWLLRHVLRKAEGELVTINDLHRFGIDSVRIVSKHIVDDDGKKVYCIEFTASDYESYSEFFDNTEE